MSFYEGWVIVIGTLCLLSYPVALIYMSLLVYTLVFRHQDKRWLDVLMPKRNAGNRELFARAFTNMSFVVVFWWLAEYTQVIDTVSFYFSVVAFFMVALSEVGLNDLWRDKVYGNMHF